MKEIKIDITEGKIKDIEEKNLTLRPFEENLEEKVDAFLAQFATPMFVTVDTNSPLYKALRESTWRLTL